MKITKCMLIILLSCILLSCANKKTEVVQPTGYPSGEINQPQIMYNDIVYYYQATGFDEILPSDYVEVGTVEDVNSEITPSENFHGARIEKGQKIFCNDGANLYVEYESGYAKFSPKK